MSLINQSLLNYIEDNIDSIDFYQSLIDILESENYFESNDNNNQELIFNYLKNQFIQFFTQEQQHSEYIINQIKQIINSDEKSENNILIQKFDENISNFQEKRKEFNQYLSEYLENNNEDMLEQLYVISYNFCKLVHNLEPHKHWSNLKEE